MGKFEDLTGQVFGRLVVVGTAPKSRTGLTRWECSCACGKTTSPLASSLKRGETRSCGCLKDELTAERCTVHGKCGTPEYNSWRAIKDRVLNPKCKKYVDYGGRGITMCGEWVNDFDAFLNHIGPRPSPQHTVDRTDNDRGYEPGNVRWALPAEQNRNQRSNRLLTLEGRTMHLADWATEVGVTPATLVWRLKNWTLERALTAVKK